MPTALIAFVLAGDFYVLYTGYPPAISFSVLAVFFVLE
jgi:hypothetical protein